MHRADKTDLIGHLAQMRQYLGQFNAALPLPGELKSRPKNIRIRTNKRIALPADDRRRYRLALKFRERGLGVKQIKMARRTGHEKMNHRLGLARKHRRASRQRRGRQTGRCETA